MKEQAGNVSGPRLTSAPNTTTSPSLIIVGVSLGSSMSFNQVPCMEPMSWIVTVYKILVETRPGMRQKRHTLFSESNSIVAWLRDITGLSNQALSTAPSIPLVTLFDALPTGMTLSLAVSVRVRSAMERSPFKAVRVTLATLLSAGVWHIVRSFEVAREARRSCSW